MARMDDLPLEVIQEIARNAVPDKTHIIKNEVNGNVLRLRLLGKSWASSIAEAFVRKLVWFISITPDPTRDFAPFQFMAFLRSTQTGPFVSSLVLYHTRRDSLDIVMEQISTLLAMLTGLRCFSYFSNSPAPLGLLTGSCKSLREVSMLSLDPVGHLREIIAAGSAPSKLHLSIRVPPRVHGHLTLPCPTIDTLHLRQFDLSHLQLLHSLDISPKHLILTVLRQDLSNGTFESCFSHLSSLYTSSYVFARRLVSIDLRLGGGEDLWFRVRIEERIEKPFMRLCTDRALDLWIRIGRIERMLLSKGKKPDRPVTRVVVEDN